MVALAHMFALGLIIATSVASLISLAGEAVAQFVAGHASIPQVASITITLFLVAAMDTGMLYAAGMVRSLSTRRTAEGTRVHQAVIAIVGTLEAGTYAYMLVQFEQPHNVAAWSLIIARALAVPVLSVYLSLARSLAISPSDISYQMELAVGVGLLRDLATLAQDPDAQLHKKIAMYRAAADLTDGQAGKMDAMYLAATLDTPSPLPPVTVIEATGTEPEPEPEPPQGKGVRTRPRGVPKPDQTSTRKANMKLVRAMLNEDPETSVSAIMKRLHVARSTAHSLQNAVLSERQIMLVDDARRRA